MEELKQAMILMIEDDPGDCQMVKQILAEPQHPVEFTIDTASTLAEGLECLKKGGLDLVLLDLELKDSSGLDTFDKAYKASPHTPIVVLTELSGEEAGIESIKRGASNYLVKNRYLEDLLAHTIRSSLEHKWAGDTLKTLEEKLNSSNRELQDFAYIISHDLKAPLRGITTLVEWILADHADKLDENGKEQLDMLSSRVGRMHNLINGTLAYSRAGNVNETKTQVNLNELIPGIIEELDVPENIEIKIEDKLPVIECAQNKITQVFQNLLSNAIKHMDKPDGKISVGCFEDDSFWKFSVTDNGPGIEEKHFERIFQMFHTLLPKDEVESTGVGLTVAKKIIGVYGGKIWIESEPDEGSVFFFTLPKQEIEVKSEKLKTNTVC